MTEKQSKMLWARSAVILVLTFVLGFSLCSGALVKEMIFDADELRAKAEEQQLFDIVTTAKRGNIYDTDMNVLATSSTVWQVFVTSGSVDEEDKAPIAQGISDILGLEYDKVLAKVSENSKYVTIGEPISAETATTLREFISENEYGSVVGLEETSKRYYPNDNLASTVIGFVGTDNQGLYGLEYEYDEELTGTAGRIVAAKNAKGAQLPFSYEKVIDAEDGNSLVLTIDEYIQHVVEKYLDKAVEENKVENRGCCIVMDVNSGEILAMATKPDYNLNEPFEIGDSATLEAINEIEDEAERKAALKLARETQWSNKCINEAYEPGSVFKVITGAAALETGAITTNFTYSCPGYIVIGGERIKCHKTEGHGHQSLQQAFENSCNPAFITIGQTLGKSYFTSFRKAFGLESITGIDLPGEAGSIYHAESAMGVVELASESFGQTFKVTPIQLITAFSAAVNGGYLYTPHVVKQIIDSDGNVVENIESTLVNQVISEETSEQLCEYLGNIVASGSGKNAYVAGYRVGGKTGTSQKIDERDENKEEKYVASFCGVAPTDDPQIACLLLLDEPNGDSYYGGTIASPVAADILEEILPYIGVTPQYTEDEAEKLESNAPDLIGKKVSEAKSAASEAELSIKVVGEGDTVLRQVPGATSTIPSGGTIVVYTDDSSEKTMATVPDFTGMTVSQANIAAKNAGLNMSINGTAENSTAYAQSIEKGTSVEAGTIITVSFRGAATD